MNRHAVQATISPYTSPKDTSLYNIQQTLAGSYWACKSQGVFSFQFLVDYQPITNQQGIYFFNLLRYTPTYSYTAFNLSIPGRLNNDGTFEYGGGRTGMLKTINNNLCIVWDDGSIWHKVNQVPATNTDIINLNLVESQAGLDSLTIGSIVNSHYYY
jgi:hypothetical protein